MNIKGLPGQLTLIIGPMLSAKTTLLLHYYKRHVIKKKKILSISHCADNRYEENSICSHDGQKVECDKRDTLCTDLSYYLSSDVICLDELQLFPYTDFDKFYEVIKQLLLLGKEIYVVSLLSGVSGTTFPHVSHLLPLATHIVRTTSCCSICNDDHALFVQRKVGTEDLGVIGNQDKYLVLCLKCNEEYEKKHGKCTYNGSKFERNKV
jgi:thymidine kinase